PGRALAADDRLGTALVGVTLTVEQVVTGGPDGPVTWHLAIADGKVALAAGPAPRAEVRLSTDYPTAAGVAACDLAAQRAFVEGRLRIGGDLSLLLAHPRALGRGGDARAPVRAETTY